MGVAGAGKTVVGRALAAAVGIPFHDADDFHSAEAVAMMRSGHPLTDSDRAPWLERLATMLGQIDAAGSNAVLACSALKERYRSVLRAPVAPGRIVFVHLQVSRETAEARLRGRHSHYMPPALVDSQFETLEPPVDAIQVDGSAPVADIVQTVVRQLRW
jgi:gluconokinase